MKNGVVFGEGPGAVDVIGQDDDGINGKGEFGFDGMESLAE